MLESNFEQIADFLHEILEISLKIQEKSGPKLKDFAAALEGNDELKSVRERVNKFATSFPMPGFDPKTMKYQDPNGP
jgi:glycine hydroxymethyltransferase